VEHEEDRGREERGASDELGRDLGKPVPAHAENKLSLELENSSRIMTLRELSVGASAETLSLAPWFQPRTAAPNAAPNPRTDLRTARPGA
jgi:hypothetical protein